MKTDDRIFFRENPRHFLIYKLLKYLELILKTTYSDLVLA